MNGKRRRPAISMLGVLLVLIGTQGASSQPFKRTVTEKPLGKVDLSKYDAKKPTFWVSPNGRHAAWLTEKGIVVDGNTKEYIRGVKEKSFVFSPDGEHWAYVAALDGKGANYEFLFLDGVEGKTGYNSISRTPVFSPDSKHVAFFGSKYVGGDKPSFIVVDGQESKPEKDFAWEMAFTPDSKRLVYGVESPEKQMVMREQTIDGSEPHRDRPHRPATLIHNFFFGPAGQVGYIAKASEKQCFVVYDGKEETHRFAEIKVRDIVISEDGKHVAYFAEPESFADVVVINGKPSKVYKAFDGDIIPGSLGLSPDGSRDGYSVKKGRQAFVVIDGKEGQPYANVGGPLFSPDSKYVAYQAASGGKLVMVLNGKAGQGYDKIGLPEFSPDSSTVAYWAESGGKSFMVVNGQKQKAYDSVGLPHFSKDSKRLAYLAKVGGKWLLVDSGKEQKAYDDMDGMLYFSGDGQRLATIFGEGDQQLVVVDGVEGNRYDTIVTIGGGKLHFATSDRLHYLATKGGNLILVEETIE